ALVSKGAVQIFHQYDTAKLIEPQQVQHISVDGKPAVGPDGKPVMDTVTDQVIAQGPVASQEAIKMLGTNGGDFSAPTVRIHSKTPRHLATICSSFPFLLFPPDLP